MNWDWLTSRHVRFLERELIQVRLEKDRQIAELKAEKELYLAKLLEVKGIPLRMPIYGGPIPTNPAKEIPLTKWQQVQQKAVEEAAKFEEEQSHGVQE